MVHKPLTHENMWKNNGGSGLYDEITRFLKERGNMVYFILVIRERKKESFEGIWFWKMKVLEGLQFIPPLHCITRHLGGLVHKTKFLSSIYLTTCGNLPHGDPIMSQLSLHPSSTWTKLTKQSHTHKEDRIFYLFQLYFNFHNLFAYE